MAFDRFPASRLYDLKPPCPGDAAGLGGWDTGIASRGLATKEGTELTLGFQQMAANTQFQPFVGLRSLWLTDRLTLYVVEFRAPLAVPPVLEFQICNGADMNQSPLVSVSWTANTFLGFGRVVQVWGVLANQWTINARVPPQDAPQGNVDVHVRIQLDRIGTACCGTPDPDHPGAPVPGAPGVLLGPNAALT